MFKATVQQLHTLPTLKLKLKLLLNFLKLVHVCCRCYISFRDVRVQFVLLRSMWPQVQTQGELDTTSNIRVWQAATVSLSVL